MSDTLEYNSETGTYRTRYKIGRDSLSVVVVQAIAEIEEVDPTRLPPLIKTIDLEALIPVLQSAINGKGGDVQVTFSYHGYQVVIHSYGVIEVQRTESSEDDSGAMR